MTQSHFLIGLYTGGLMEDPEIKVSGKEIVQEATRDGAVAKYNRKHNCTYFYGDAIASVDASGVITTYDPEHFTMADHALLLSKIAENDHTAKQNDLAACLSMKPRATASAPTPTPPPAVTETCRGFAVAKFRDRYNHQCSIQDSSAATEPCLWLGVDQDVIPQTRMHLTQDQVRALLPLLTRFVETGSIGEPR